MKLLALSTFVAAVTARAFGRDVSPLLVDLSVEGNTGATISVKNVGTAPLKIFKTGSILDDREIERVKVTQNGEQESSLNRQSVPFSGIRLYISPSHADESAFETINPGQSISKSWDVASTHDLSSGGTFDLSAAGGIAYASPESTSIEGTIPFQSNPVTTEVDGDQAAVVHAHYQARMKRSIVQSDCTGANKAAIEAAFPICAARATAAAAAALTNSAKVKEYFKSDTNATKQAVSSVFTKVAAECGSTTGGFSKTYCTDIGRSCSGGVIAYANPYPPSNAYMVYCTGWFNIMQAKSTVCHHDDRPFVTMHELTHLTQIKGTDDYGTYGYAGTMKLSGNQNLNHADSYALFSNAIDVGGTC